ncbi:MAG: LysR family transcriptional regulator, partial [Bacilli bacterium]
MNTFQLECFLAVSNTLSFVRAAEQLNISQPAITHQIKTLEDELNVVLFKRSTRFVEITQEGLSFIGDAKKIIEIVLQAKMRYQSSKNIALTTLSIGCSYLAQLNSMKKILEYFNNEIPNFHPKIEIASRSQLFYLLENGNIDVFFSHYDTNKVNDIISYHQIKEDKLVCIMKKDNALSSYASLSIEDIKKEKVILIDPLLLTNQMNQFQLHLLDGKSTLDFQFCSSFEIATTLVESGFGIALIPQAYLD